MILCLVNCFALLPWPEQCRLYRPACTVIKGTSITWSRSHHPCHSSAICSFHYMKPEAEVAAQFDADVQVCIAQEFMCYFVYCLYHSQDSNDLIDGISICCSVCMHTNGVLGLQDHTAGARVERLRKLCGVCLQVGLDYSAGPLNKALLTGAQVGPKVALISTAVIMIVWSGPPLVAGPPALVSSCKPPLHSSRVIAVVRLESALKCAFANCCTCRHARKDKAADQDAWSVTNQKCRFLKVDNVWQFVDYQVSCQLLSLKF